MDEENKSEASNLRQKAEELVKMKSLDASSFKSESEVLKLIHDLEVHKTELKIQNEELLLIREQTSTVLEKYINLYNFAPSGYFILSKDGIISDSNYSGNKMIRQEHRSLINSRFDYYLSEDTKQIFNSFLNKIFDSKIRESCVVTLSTDNKMPVYVYLTGLANDKSNDCILNMVDISSIKQTEEELKNKVDELTNANKKIALQNEEKEERTAKLITINKELEQSIRLNAEKDLFVSILAHDLKSPLSVLIDYSDLVLEKVHEHNINEVEILIRKIKKSTQNTYNLLEDLLKWSKVQSGKIPFEPQVLSFKSICNDVIEILAPNANAKNINISFSGSDKITVLADADMLKGVLRNLVSNAIKFTENNGSIMINAVQSRLDILFSVTDTGSNKAGISEQAVRYFKVSYNIRNIRRKRYRIRIISLQNIC